MKTVSQMMDILMAELIKELRKRGTLESLCTYSLYPGDQIALDYGECGGMAWIRLVTANPSRQFPNPAQDPNNCASTIAYNLEMGIVRPVEIPRLNAAKKVILPSAEQNTESAHAQMEDLDAMQTAIKRASKDIEMLQLQNYIPLGPEGGIAGGAWDVWVGDD